MSDKAFDMEIGLGMEYDPSGAAAANADIEKLKQNAAAVQPPGSGGSAAEATPGSGGAAAAAQQATQAETGLAKARQETAEVSKIAAFADEQLTAARTQSGAAATQATGAEQQLAVQRRDSAQASAAAGDAEQQAAEQTAAATEKRSKASEQSAAAMEREQLELEAIRAQMELEAKGRDGLIREINRLSAARAAAAKAGDVEAFRDLDAQVKQAKKAFEHMNREMQISKIGMMGQMQLALQVGSTLQSFGESCRNGTASVMGLANATLALGSAIKAGMGPLGWVALAIQGLQMAWDWYSDSQKEAAEAERARIAANNEALARHMEQVQKLAALSRENMLASARAELEDIGAKFDKLTAQQEQAARRTEQREAAAEQRRRAAAQAVFDAEQARVELARTLGRMSEAEATARLNAAEEVLARELAAVDELEKKRTNAAAIEAKRRAEKEAAELSAAIEQKFAGTDSLLKLELPSAQEWEALQIKYTEGLTDAVENAAETRIRGELQKLRRLMESMGIAFEGGDEELLRWLDDLRSAREEADKMLEAARAEAEAAGQKAELARLELDTKKQEAAAETAAREARRKQQEAAVQNQQLAQQWAEVQRQALPAQVKWLEQTVAGLAAGSEAAEKWARQLEAVKLRQVQEELGGLATVYKVTGHYAARDARTQEEIYAADRSALEARCTALEQLRQQPGLDAATQKQINEKLAETHRQLAGLEDAVAASAAAAQQMLAGLRPLGQQAQQSNWAHALKRSEQAFLNMAVLAERQAKSGDTAGMERTVRAMHRLAAQQERLTGNTGRAAKHAQEVERNLRAVAQQGGKQDAAQKRQTRAANRAAAAKEKEARAAEQQAREAAADGKKKPEAAAADVAGLTAQLEAARQALATQQQEVARLRGAVEALAKVTAEVAEMARRTAAAAAEGTRAAQGALAGQRRELTGLRRAVEMLKKL